MGTERKTIDSIIEFFLESGRDGKVDGIMITPEDASLISDLIHCLDLNDENDPRLRALKYIADQTGGKYRYNNALEHFEWVIKEEEKLEKGEKLTMSIDYRAPWDREDGL